MPGREVHTSIGTVVGIWTAATRTPPVTSGVPLPELGGGAIGGYWGSRFPDLIEPASSPWHRDPIAQPWVESSPLRSTNSVDWRSTVGGKRHIIASSDSPRGQNPRAPSGTLSPNGFGGFWLVSLPASFQDTFRTLFSTASPVKGSHCWVGSGFG